MGTSKRDPGTVLVRLQGGLGNQLFQYAAGLAVARETGALVRCEPSDSPGIALRDVLPQGNVTLAAPADWNRLRLSKPGDPVLSRARNRATQALPGYRRRCSVVVQGRSTQRSANDPRTVVVRTPSCYLSGWFIHRSWFEPVLDAVARPLLQRLCEHPAFASARGATIVSFRRGDYVRFGYDLGLDYYERAIERVRANDRPCWVVSDDAAFARLASDWLTARGLSAAPAPAFEGSTALAHLALLAGAERVVMSNSTFCWWGVVAGDTGASGRQVTVPSPWIAGGERGIQIPDWAVGDGDLYQPTWEPVVSSPSHGPH